MNEVVLMVCVGATYLVIGAWVIGRTDRSRMGVPVKVRRDQVPAGNPARRRDRDNF